MSNGVCVSMCADFILDYHESMGSYLNRGEGYRKLNAKSRKNSGEGAEGAGNRRESYQRSAFSSQLRIEDRVSQETSLLRLIAEG